MIFEDVEEFGVGVVFCEFLFGFGNFGEVADAVDISAKAVDEAVFDEFFDEFFGGLVVLADDAAEVGLEEDALFVEGEEFGIIGLHGVVAFGVSENDVPAFLLEREEDVLEIVVFAAHRQLDEQEFGAIDW